MSAYGPVWLNLAYILMAAVPPVVSHQVAAFKLTAIIVHLANVAVIWYILRRLAPRRRLFGTILYAWNPLLLIEFNANGHNDVIMVFYMLVALLFFVHGHRTWPIIFLTLAILTKWIAVFVLPLYILAVCREETAWNSRWRFVLTSSGLMAVTSVALYVPYWDGPASFTAMFDSAAVERFINSFPELLVSPLTSLLVAISPSFIPRAVLTENTAGYMIKAGLGLVFVVLWLREWWRASASSSIVESWLRTLFAYLALVCVWFWPWYVGWLIPLAALRPEGRWGKASILLSFSAASFYSLWPGAPLRPFEPYYDLRSVALFGPPIVYLLASVFLKRARLALLASKTEYTERDIL